MGPSNPSCPTDPTYPTETSYPSNQQIRCTRRTRRIRRVDGRQVLQTDTQQRVAAGQPGFCEAPPVRPPACHVAQLLVRRSGLQAVQAGSGRLEAAAEGKVLEVARPAHVPVGGGGLQRQDREPGIEGPSAEAVEMDRLRRASGGNQDAAILDLHAAPPRTSAAQQGASSEQRARQPGKWAALLERAGQVQRELQLAAAERHALHHPPVFAPGVRSVRFSRAR